VVEGNKLTFNWSQDGGYEGTGEFTMNADGKGFKGSSTALKPQQFTNTWNSFVPEPLSLAGTWETISNDAPFTMTLQQEGDQITGTYTPGNGRIEGTLKDRILRFKWASDGGAGSGRFVFAKSEMAFSGSYSNSDDPEQADGLWNGTRKLGGSGGKKVVTFAGTWVKVLSIGNVITTTTYKFQQSGTFVTGYFFLGTDETLKLDIVGNVQGNTLNMFTHRGDFKVIDSGKLVMAQDGNSFSGKIGNSSVTANFFRR
jgi:hypothetical protein